MPRPPQRPYMVLNMAMSADGKIATANRAVSSFGSQHDHRHLYELRAGADALLCGATTAGEPGVNLDLGGPRYHRLRARRGLPPTLLRVIASGQARLDPEAPVFRDRTMPTFVLVAAAAPERRVQRLRRLADHVMPFGDARLDLVAALHWLHTAHGIRRLVCEGGAELNDALFRAGLVDELHLTVCPRLVGGGSAPTLAEGAGVQRLAEAQRLRLRQCRRVGDELFLVFRSAKPRASRT